MPTRTTRSVSLLNKFCHDSNAEGVNFVAFSMQIRSKNRILADLLGNTRAFAVSEIIILVADVCFSVD